MYKELKKQASVEPVLIHSRFRPQDRAAGLKRLLADPPVQGTIAVTTQVVEAGVDISAKVLFTELAPWPSLVQRFGRCNRKGEFNEAKDARVCWFDVPDDEKSRANVEKPYELGDILEARELLQTVSDVGPASLEQMDAQMRLEPGFPIWLL